MRKIFFCTALTFLCFSLKISAQDLAALEAAFSTSTDPAQQLEMLQKMAKVAEQTDLQQSMNFIKQGVALAEKSGNKEYQPRFYEMQGRIYANTQRADSASIFFEKALTGYVAAGDQKGEASAWLKKAFISRWNAEFEKALEYDFKALAIMEALKDDSGVAKCTNIFPVTSLHRASPLRHWSMPKSPSHWRKKAATTSSCCIVTGLQAAPVF